VSLHISSNPEIKELYTGEEKEDDDDDGHISRERKQEINRDMK
jgi:hypothetical protein